MASFSVIRIVRRDVSENSENPQQREGVLMGHSNVSKGIREEYSLDNESRSIKSTV